jgi:RND family efflux transporter MFP subunit
MLRILHCIVVFFVAVVFVTDSWAEPGSRGTPVTATSVVRDTVVITEESMGWIETKVNPEVAAEVSGRIQEIFVDTGQTVESGVPMVTIDSEHLKIEKQALQSEVDRLEALIANQKRTVERYRNLLAKKSTSQERFDNAEVKLITLREQLQGALSRLADNKRRMAKTSVLAPVGGWIEKRFVSEGDFVKEGTPLFLLVTDQFLRIVLPFPESVAASLATGQQVKLTSPLSGNRVIEAKINQIRPAVNIHSRAVEVIIYLENPGGWRPGGTINGTVIIDRHTNGMLVPAQAIVRRPAGKVVYQIENNTAHQRQVSTGRRQGDLVEIINGLSGDERIIVDGAGFLTDGAAVVEKQQ